MTFGDIFKKSFLESITTGDISLRSLLITFFVTCVFAIYIFVMYRVTTRKTFYNKNFNNSLVVVAIIVSAIVITIQSSLVVSLGMVGALSIVRFRTAVKDPIDLVFMFWSIAIGIICGAGLPGVAFIMSIVITGLLFVLEIIPVAKAPVLLIISGAKRESRESILKVVEDNTKRYTIKAQTLDNSKLDMIIQIQIKKEEDIIEQISKIDGLSRYSLVNHDGEVTF